MVVHGCHFSCSLATANADATIATGYMATVVEHATAIATASCCCITRLLLAAWFHDCCYCHCDH